MPCVTFDTPKKLLKFSRNRCTWIGDGSGAVIRIEGHVLHVVAQIIDLGRFDTSMVNPTQVVTDLLVLLSFGQEFTIVILLILELWQGAHCLGGPALAASFP